MNKMGLFRSSSTLLFLALCLGGAGCAPVRSISFDPNDPNADAYAVAPIVTNARFEIHPAQPTLKPSRGLWMRQSIEQPDMLAVRWDDFSDLSNDTGVDCNFEEPSAACPRCNACHTPGMPQACNFSPIYSGFTPIQLYHYFYFHVERPGTLVREPMPVEGCKPPAGQGPRILIEHPHTGTYKLVLSSNYHNPNPVERPPVAEFRVWTAGGAVHLVPYELTRLNQNVSSPTLAFFSGTIPTVGGMLQENYSNRLSIGKVRVLKGTPSVDPTTGSFALTDWSVVKPSRLVFINDFREGAQILPNGDGIRCYGRYGPSLPDDDGDFDLTRCRPANDSPQTESLEGTPAYLATNPEATLTWVAEFNATDFPAIGGGEMPTLDGQVLAIEFRIL